MDKHSILKCIKHYYSKYRYYTDLIDILYIIIVSTDTVSILEMIRYNKGTSITK
jgi:hypothetical protein